MDKQMKILLVYLHSNGDCLYATAIARQIKHDYPGCHLTWAIASFCKSIIENNPYVDTIWEIPGVNKDTNVAIHRRLKHEAQEKKAAGEYDEVFFTQIIDDNIANYDGCIRSAIFRGYGRPITEGIQPVLRLRNEEIQNAARFAETHGLQRYKNVILFEFAPQSGQLAITTETAIAMAEKAIGVDGTAVILSSAKRIVHDDPRVIDGSQLTLRETAALTNYCTLLMGCSSGISWISTSDAAKQLPMLQILDPNAVWVNPISRDFERFGLPTNTLIELYVNDPELVTGCLRDILTVGFDTARQRYFSPLPLQFRTTSRSIYNMLCFLQFGAIVKHIRINISVFGFHPLLLWEIFLGFATAPFKLVRNVVSKRFGKKK